MNINDELIDLFQTSRIALSGKDDSTWARMCWAAREFNKLHPEITSTNAYKRLSSHLGRTP